MHRSMNQDEDKDSFLNNMLIKSSIIYACISYLSSVKLIRTLEQRQTWSNIFIYLQCFPAELGYGVF